jgi:hypothetical protein
MGNGFVIVVPSGLIDILGDRIVNPEGQSRAKTGKGQERGTTIAVIHG